MSGKISGMVWDCDLPQSEKFILLAYADHADHEGGSIFPSIALIAWKTGFSARHIQRVKADLIKRNIFIEEGFSARGTTLLRINLANLPIKAARLNNKGGDTVSPPYEKKNGKIPEGGGDTVSGGGDTIVSGGGDTIVSPEPSINRQLTSEPNGSRERKPAKYKPPEIPETNPVFLKYPILKKMKRANRDLMLAFFENTGIKPIDKDYKFYLKTTYEMIERGITPEIIKKSIKKMRQDQLVISGPQSVMKVAISLSAEENGRTTREEEFEKNKAIMQEQVRRDKESGESEKEWDEFLNAEHK